MASPRSYDASGAMTGVNCSPLERRARETPSSAAARMRIRLEQYAKDLETAVALDVGLINAILLRAQMPSGWWLPDETIRLLPEDCWVKTDALGQFPGSRPPQIEHWEMEIPEFVPPPKPTCLVGKVRASFTADQHRSRERIVQELGAELEGPSPGQQFGRRRQSQGQRSSPPMFLVIDPPAPTAGRDVFLHPRAISPYFDLVTEDIVIDFQDVEFNECADTEIKRLETTYTLMENWHQALILGWDTWGLQVRHWRKARREWELKAVQEVFLTANLFALEPHFGIANLVRAFLQIMTDNVEDDLGQIPRWIHVWDKDAYDKTRSDIALVERTMYRLKWIRWGLMSEEEHNFPGNRRLRFEMEMFADKLDQTRPKKNRRS